MPRHKTRCTKGKLKLSKVSVHEHNLLHLLLIAEVKGKLNAFMYNLDYMHGGLDYADLLIEQNNFTIFSAFPWAQTGDEGCWKQLKNDVAVSLQYPTYRGVEDECN